MKLKTIAIGVALSALSVAAWAAEDEGAALAKNSGCTSCHSVDKKMMGPAFKDVAAKYKGDAAAKATLIASIRNGSKGKWGSAMPATPAKVSDADVDKLASYILSLDK